LTICALIGRSEVKSSYQIMSSEDEDITREHSNQFSKRLSEDLSRTVLPVLKLKENTKSLSLKVGCGVSQECSKPVGKNESIQNTSGSQSTCSKSEQPVKQRVMAGYRIPKLGVAKDTPKEKSSAIKNRNKKAPRSSNIPALEVHVLETPENSTSTQKPEENERVTEEEKEECQETVVEDQKAMHKSRFVAEGNLNCDLPLSIDLNCKNVPNGRVNVRELVRKALDVHFDKGHIKNRQYKRILERATLKIEKHTTDIPIISENRVKKLVADYVEAYRSADLECK